MGTSRTVPSDLLPHNVPLAETEWYQRWLDGDPEAWEQLVQAYFPMIYQFCYHFTQRHCLAEEYTQEIFLKLFQALPRLGHHTNLKYWLLRTAYNYCVDAHRRMVNERKYLRRFWLEAREWWRVNVQEIHATHRDYRRILQRLIAALPEELRVVIILREFMELAYDEIARLLHIPLGTVKSRLNRARNLLYQQLCTQYPELLSAPYDDLVTTRTSGAYYSLKGEAGG